MDNRNHYEMKRMVDQARRTNRERYENSSKQRLNNILAKKFQTTMIGALAEFEKHFGELWGHGVDPNELTADECRWRDIWEIVRTEILNNGNHNLRSALAELAQYTISWNRYHTDFIIKK